MIRSFGDKGLERFAAKGDASRLRVQKPDRLRRMLAQLEFSTVPRDMNLPGFGFHALTGDRRGTFSVSVSGNWRMTFEWDGEDAFNVTLEDYH